MSTFEAEKVSGKQWNSKFFKRLNNKNQQLNSSAMEAVTEP